MLTSSLLAQLTFSIPSSICGDIPSLCEEVIKYLDELFPDKCPNLEETEKQVWFKAGQRSVVNHLIKEQKVQEEK